MTSVTLITVVAYYFIVSLEATLLKWNPRCIKFCYNQSDVSEASPVHWMYLCKSLL